MKEFLKMTGATLVGLLLFSVISTFICFGILGALVAVSDAPTDVRDNSVLELKLNGNLVERNEEDELSMLMQTIDDSRAVIGLDELLSAIEKAQNNDNIKGIYLNIGSFSAAPASLAEIRQALQRFKESGKFIVAYADSYSNGTYALATVADCIALNPRGDMGLTGLSMNTLYYKDALDKLGIEMQIFKVGTFKSAVEPYISMQMSDANRLQLTQLSNSIWSNFTQQMATGRHLSDSVFNNFANEANFLAEATVSRDQKLVDTLVYRSEMKGILESYAGKDYATATLKTMNNLPDDKKYSANKIAIVYAYGTIDDGSDDGIDSEDICKALIDAADDDHVKAVVLRVNSPGGSAYGSEQMWHATQLVKAKKPLIVSMGDYAASGGYYMSCAADLIVAQPTTITGSIGIFGILPNVQGLTQKIGVAMDGVKTNEYADMGNIMRPLTATERIKFQQSIDHGYELFVKRCADGRNLTTDSIKQIAEGRVWTGIDAKNIGLVDTLGGLDMAIEIAAERADLAEYNLKELPAKRDWMTSLMEDLTENVKVRVMQKELGASYRYLKALQQAQNMQGVQAIMPFNIYFE